MGTNGAYGFRLDGKDKIAYNQFDSYPEKLGQVVMDFISNTPLERMRAIASNINLVNKVTESSICEEIIKDTFGNLNSIFDMERFLNDSLFCEWAYIMNLDTKRLEVYTGLNKDPHAPGRYSNGYIENNQGYKGVVLKKEISFSEITKDSIDGLVKELDLINNLEELIVTE